MFAASLILSLAPLAALSPTSPAIWLPVIILFGILCFAWIYRRYGGRNGDRTGTGGPPPADHVEQSSAPQDPDVPHDAPR